jgi:hypothetical protein
MNRAAAWPAWSLVGLSVALIVGWIALTRMTEPTDLELPYNSSLDVAEEPDKPWVADIAYTFVPKRALCIWPSSSMPAASMGDQTARAVENALA